MKSAPEALPAGIEELAYRGGVAHRVIGGRRRVDEDVRDEAGARLVDIAQACFVDETVQGIAPRKIGLKELAVRCAILPRWVSEALVAGRLGPIGSIRADFPEFAEESKPLLAGDDRLADHGLEQDRGAVDQILTPEAYKRIERKRVARSLFGERIRQRLEAGLVSAARHAASPYWARSALLSNLPTLVLAKASTNSILCGTANFDITPLSLNART